MLIYKIIGVGVTGAILSLLVKQHKPEIAITIPILTSAIIILMCVPYLSATIEAFDNIAELAGIEILHMKTLIKIIGVAYICQFASDICADAGEKAIAGRIELGGRIIILTLSMPIIFSLLSLIVDIIDL